MLVAECSLGGIMALALTPDPSVEGRIDEVVDALRNISKRYGFDASIEGNERVLWVERMRLFVSKCTYTPNCAKPTHTIKNAFAVRRGQVPVGQEVSLSGINELALIWGLVFIDHSYTGLHAEEAIDLLKCEVIRFLELSGYRLPERCLRFCTAANDWRRYETLWRAVRDYNAQQTLNASAPVPTVPTRPACLGCPLIAVQ